MCVQKHRFLHDKLPRNGNATSNAKRAVHTITAQKKTTAHRSIARITIYKYILCSAFNLIVAIAVVVVVVVVAVIVVNVLLKGFELSLPFAVVVDFIIMHSTYVLFYYYYCSPLDLIHTRCFSYEYVCTSVFLLLLRSFLSV